MAEHGVAVDRLGPFVGPAREGLRRVGRRRRAMALQAEQQVERHVGMPRLEHRAPATAPPAKARSPPTSAARSILFSTSRSAAASWRSDRVADAAVGGARRARREHRRPRSRRRAPAADRARRDRRCGRDRRRPRPRPRYGRSAPAAPAAPAASPPANCRWCSRGSRWRARPCRRHASATSRPSMSSAPKSFTSTAKRRPVGAAQQAVQQRRLAGAEEAADDGEGDHDAKSLSEPEARGLEEHEQQRTHGWERATPWRVMGSGRP